MLAPRVAPRERRHGRGRSRHRHEVAAIEPQQAGGITGDQPPHQREQAPITVGRRQRRRRIAGDIEEHFERLVVLLIRQRCCHWSTFLDQIITHSRNPLNRKGESSGIRPALLPGRSCHEYFHDPRRTGRHHPAAARVFRRHRLDFCCRRRGRSTRSAASGSSMPARSSPRSPTKIRWSLISSAGTRRRSPRSSNTSSRSTTRGCAHSCRR